MAKAPQSDDIKIEQKPDIAGDVLQRDPEIVRADQVISKNYADELAFNEEPVTIRLEPSAERNASSVFQLFNNGKGCEMLIRGRWVEMPAGFIPVGQPITIKRKYLEIIARAKLDRVETAIIDPDSDRPNNTIKRFTSSVSSFSVLEDKNPRGNAWLTELFRRNG